MFFKESSLAIAEKSKSGERVKDITSDAEGEAIHSYNKLRFAEGIIPTITIRLDMKECMQRSATVFRTQKSLSEGF